MRLIDADKLKQELKVNGLGYQYYMLDNAPTVEAIPVEWIKKYIEDNTSTMVNPKYVDDTYNYIQFTDEPVDYYLTVMPFQVKVMLEKWRKENETNRCR